MHALLFWSDFLDKNEIRLDPRLSLCAAFVRDGAKVADIGTDHAFLPVSLVKSGKIPCAIAVDINKGPLESGTRTIKQFGLSNRISTRLSNGLEKISPNECDDIIIAGMGGELICSIISSAVWLKSNAKHLILQPMTHAETLREFLYSNRFEIIREQAVKSDGRLYTVILAVYYGKKNNPSHLLNYVGKLKPTEREIDKLYIEYILLSLKKKHSGLKQGKRRSEASKVSQTIKKIKDFMSGGLK